ncbi:MAG: nicotinamide riboside transporter PnuC [Kiritimatiellae bacterium]|nr:nicotinamide riboside transporter PnuC [Kiritimatiellia bacterium]
MTWIGLPVATVDWLTILGSSPLEIIATVCSILGVFLIARQNWIGWPLGLVWAGISTYLAFGKWHLVSDGVTYAAYIPIQCYCWWVWARRSAHADTAPFLPTWLSRKTQGLLIVGSLLAIGVWGLSVSYLANVISWIPTPSLLWRDSTTTVLNFIAQFLQAKKRMENWVGWVIVNLLGIHIYWVKDAPIYSFQYAFFLCLGIYGWWAWSKSRAAALKSATT